MPDYPFCPTDLLAPWRDRFVRPEADIRADLERLLETLSKWQAAQNLVSRETLAAFWTRHVADSLQLLPHLPAQPSRLYDLGSGGGFPALPMAIARKGAEDSFVLVEANQRKAAFLRAVIRDCGLNARVLAQRIEAVGASENGRADMVTARALAPLSKLFELANPLLSDCGTMLFLKGRDYRDELDTAGAEWQFDVLISPSATDPEGVILKIDRLARKSV